MLSTALDIFFVHKISFQGELQRGARCHGGECLSLQRRSKRFRGRIWAQVGGGADDARETHGQDRDAVGSRKALRVVQRPPGKSDYYILLYYILVLVVGKGAVKLYSKLQEIVIGQCSKLLTDGCQDVRKFSRHMFGEISRHEKFPSVLKEFVRESERKDVMKVVDSIK